MNLLLRATGHFYLLVKPTYCAIDADQKAVCWGYGSSGQLDVPEDSFVEVDAGLWQKAESLQREKFSAGDVKETTWGNVMRQQEPSPH